MIMSFLCGTYMSERVGIAGRFVSDVDLLLYDTQAFSPRHLYCLLNMCFADTIDAAVGRFGTSGETVLHSPSIFS